MYLCEALRLSTKLPGAIYLYLSDSKVIPLTFVSLSVQKCNHFIYINEICDNVICS